MSDKNFEDEWESIVTFALNPLTNMLDEGITAESKRPFTVEKQGGFVKQIYDMLNGNVEMDRGFDKKATPADLHTKILNYLVSFFNI